MNLIKVGWSFFDQVTHIPKFSFSPEVNFCFFLWHLNLWVTEAFFGLVTVILFTTSTASALAWFKTLSVVQCVQIRPLTMDKSTNNDCLVGICCGLVRYFSAHPQWKEPVEVAWASVSDARWTPAFEGVEGMFPQKEAQRKSQNMLEERALQLRGMWRM